MPHDEAPWGDLAATGLTVRRLAAMLREYDITPRNHRWYDGTQSKGYSRDDFSDAWSRYCPQPLQNRSESQPVPNRPKRRIAGHAGDDSPDRDGSMRPDQPSVPGLTWAGTDGTIGTDHPHSPGQPICIRCRQPLSHDDGTRTHPNCA
ncbi:DUF3631 domain-containing protein [Kribbella sp. NBC_00359]|uniref:DUF3631 domain-containing protein n=1 Tax=Kribbella sp. NBC_00359 TaxID=2975966 RepID=UPI002E23B1F7